MGSVRMASISDIHGMIPMDKVVRYAADRGADVLVLAGDLQNASLHTSPAAYFQNEFMPALRAVPWMDVVIVPGNHDFWLRDNVSMSGTKLAENVTILVDAEKTIRGVRFYGTPWVPHICGRWCWERDEDSLRDAFSGICTGIDVLVTHSPPSGGDKMWDVSLQRGGKVHFGSSELRRAVERASPRAMVFGHIHSGDHAPGTIGTTALMNVSAVDEEYKPAYGMAMVLVDADGVEMEAGGRSEWK